MNEVTDERSFTPWAEPGFSAWNGESPEVEFCEFVGMLAKLLSPEIVIETGVGQRYVTRYLPQDRLWLGFESDPRWRTEGCVDRETPGKEDFAAADFVVLDSDPQWRIPELKLWWSHGKPGSVVVVHDCGNGHPPGSEHRQIHAAVRNLEAPGFWLRNPRGGWVGWRP